jgi:hypothetical protein
MDQKKKGGRGGATVLTLEKRITGAPTSPMQGGVHLLLELISLSLMFHHVLIGSSNE